MLLESNFIYKQFACYLSEISRISHTHINAAFIFPKHALSPYTYRYRKLHCEHNLKHLRSKLTCYVAGDLHSNTGTACSCLQPLTSLLTSSLTTSRPLTASHHPASPHLTAPPLRRVRHNCAGTGVESARRRKAFSLSPGRGINRGGRGAGLRHGKVSAGTPGARLMACNSTCWNGQVELEMVGVEITPERAIAGS